MLWIANSKVAFVGKFFFESEGKSGKILVLPLLISAQTCRVA